MTRLRAGWCLLVSGWVAVLGGCDRDDAGRTAANGANGGEAAMSSPAPPVSPEVLAAGRKVYGEFCAVCHGAAGDGQGRSAVALNPKPSNFAAGEFKVTAPAGDRLPTDAELRAAIENGVPRSAMPSFKLLGDETIDAVIAYIKTLSPKWEQGTEK